jgi:hypothetical protein
MADAFGAQPLALTAAWRQAVTARRHCHTKPASAELRYDRHVATLRHLVSGTESYLAARHLVGRASTCHLCIAKPTVSGVHAEFIWDGTGWWIQDLGSRNGTFVDGRKLASGEQAALAEGSTLIFGSPEHRYRLANVLPPQLMATPDRGAPIIAVDGLLCLPTPESGELSLFRDTDDRWVAEGEAGKRVLEEQDLVTAGGRSWRISLPVSIVRTREAGAETESEPTLCELKLDLFVSRDGEHVSARLIQQGVVVREFEYRAHLFLLVALARRRLADAAQEHLSASEHGWMYRDELIDELAIDDAQLLNLWIHRVRQQLAKAGVRGAGTIIERRAGSQQIRIGLASVVVRHA